MSEGSWDRRSRAEWRCTQGCPITKEPCPCLEALLPNLNRDRPNIATQAELNAAFTPFFETQVKNVAGFESLLRKFGLADRWEIALMIDKHVHGVQNDRLGEENGVSEGTIRNRLKSIYKKLVKNGLTQEDLKDYA